MPTPRILPVVFVAVLLILPLGCGGGDSSPTGPGTPSVTVTAPSGGTTVSGNVALRATAEHCDRVRFLVDGAEVGQDATSPYEVAWNSGSVADGSHTVTARGEGSGGNAEDAVTVTVHNAGTGTVTEAEKSVSFELFNVAHEASVLGSDAISLAAEAVWGASELSGSGTLTGTLTQTAPGSETWSYSAGPADRLVVAFSGGPTFTFVFTTFDGYLDGTWEDFVDAHILDFTVRDGASLDIRVVSDRHYVSGAAVPYTWKSTWSRQVTGTALYDNATFTLQVSHTGTQQGYTESGSAGLENEERITGTAVSGGSSMTLDEYYWASYLHDSNTGHIVRNWQMTVNSGATLGGTTYAYDTASARWEASSLINDPGAINSVREPGYWQVMGSFRRNGATIGAVEFDGPVIADTNGPNLILRFTDNQTLFLHTLVPGPGEKPGLPIMW